MFGVQRPWPVVYWWLACLGRSAGQSSNHNFIIFTPPFDLNGRKFQNQPKVFGRHCFAVGKLNSLFCTCIFIMSTEELEAFSYHQHSFLTEAGRQATPAWWLPWQSHREVNFAERFQEKFAKKKFATKCVRLCALIDLFKASCALHIFVRASFILCIYLYQHNKGLHIRTSVIWSAYILTNQVCISHQETPFVCTSNPAISCGC